MERSSLLVPLVPLALGVVPLRAGFAVVEGGPAPGGGFMVPAHQWIRPAGKSLEFGGQPVDLASSPDGGTLYVKDNRDILVVQTVPFRLRQELPFPQGGGFMHGIVVS